MISNEWLWLAMLALNFILVIAIYRYAGKTGLYVWIPISTILANIQVVKMVQLFGFEATMGNIIYGTSFLVTDILSENYGKESSKKAVYIGFFSLFAFAAIMKLAVLFNPSMNDTAQPNLEAIFNFMPRLAFASLVAYGVSQFHDVWAYHLWKSVFPSAKFLWLRNNASTIVSQFIDSMAFTLAAFWGVMEVSVLFEVFWTTYIIKFVVALADTPFLYLAYWLKQKNLVKED